MLIGRRFAVLLTLAAVSVAPAGCAPSAPRPAAPTTSGALPAPVLRACADAGTVIRTSTGRVTAALDAAVTAGERGDARAQLAAMTRLRAGYADWAGALRGRARIAPDPRLEAVLTEYAGAVDAAIARVATPADLDKLYTFTEKELDIAADHFAELCPR